MDEKSKQFIRECVKKAIPNLDPDHLKIIEGLNFEREPLKELCEEYKLPQQKTADLLTIVGAMKEPTSQIRVPEVITLPTLAADGAEIMEVTEQKPTAPKWVGFTLITIFLLLAALLVLILALHTCNGKRMDGLESDVDTLQTGMKDKATKADVVQLKKEDADIHSDISLLRISNMATGNSYESLLATLAALNGKVDLLGEKLAKENEELRAALNKKAAKGRLKVVELRLTEEEKKLNDHIAAGDKKATSAPVATHKLKIKYKPTFVDVYKTKPKTKPAKKPASKP